MLTGVVCAAVLTAVIGTATLGSPSTGETGATSSTDARLVAKTVVQQRVSPVVKKQKPMKVIPGIVFRRLPPPPPPPPPPVTEPAKATTESPASTTPAESETPASSTAPFDVHIGTFNVLGSQHSTPGGDKSRYPPASVRTAGAAGLIAKHGVHVIGTQELQDDQLRDLQSRTGFAAYPGLSWGAVETDNSILYDPNLYEFVSGSKFTVTFVGRPRPQPILRLRDRATGREFYVVNTHPSPGGGRALAERRRGQATVVSIVNQLKASGLPVFVTGDMNDRQEFFCHVVGPAQLTAPNGGSTAGGCRPPPMPIPVDWVVGSGVSWSNYWRDVTSTERRISDHIFVSALAHVG